jgi:hypothetical protein
MNGVLLRKYRGFGRLLIRFGTLCIYLLIRKSITKFVVEIKDRMTDMSKYTYRVTCLKPRWGLLQILFPFVLRLAKSPAKF